MLQMLAQQLHTVLLSFGPCRSYAHPRPSVPRGDRDAPTCGLSDKLDTADSRPPNCTTEAVLSSLLRHMLAPSTHAAACRADLRRPRCCCCCCGADVSLWPSFLLLLPAQGLKLCRNDTKDSNSFCTLSDDSHDIRFASMAISSDVDGGLVDRRDDVRADMGRDGLLRVAEANSKLVEGVASRSKRNETLDLDRF